MDDQSTTVKINWVPSCQIDLFTSCLTSQLPKYYSWIIDPEAEATDAFTQEWSHHKGFANPLGVSSLAASVKLVLRNLG